MPRLAPSFSFVPSESIYEQTRVHGALRQSPGEQRRHTPLHRERERERERESRETSAQRHLDGTCAHAHARARAPCIAPLRHGSRNASVHACAPLDGRQVALQGRAATRTVCNSTNAPPLTPLRMVDLHEPRRACALATAYPRHAHMRARPNLPATCLSAATRGGTHPLSLSLFPLLYSFNYSISSSYRSIILLFPNSSLLSTTTCTIIESCAFYAFTRSSIERLIKRDESTKSRAGFNLRLNERNFRVTFKSFDDSFIDTSPISIITPARNTFRIFLRREGKGREGSLGRLINRPITGESAYPLREIVTRSRDA